MELDQRLSQSALRLIADSSADGARAEKSGAADRILLSEVGVPDFRQEQAEDFHRLYGAQSRERLGALRNLYAELGEPEHLIVTVFCSKYLPLFRNWLLSCDRKSISVRNRILAFCLDAESTAASRNLGVKTYFIDPALYPKAGHCELFGDASFRRTMLYKNAVMLDALQLKAKVLFQDTDLIWFKDPFPLLDDGGDQYDVQIMYDGPHQLYKPLHANTGFIYLQPTDAAKALIETALYNSASILFVGGHQGPFNQILNHFVEHELLRLWVLPEHLFLNGHLFNLVNGVRTEAQNWMRDGIVLHYSWTGTMLEKRQKLQKFDLDCLGLTADMIRPQTEKRTTAEPSDESGAERNIRNEEEQGPGPGQVNLTIHVDGQDSLYLTCSQSAQILRTLFNILLKKSNRNNDSLIHLRIEDDKGSKDIYLRSARINGIETEPPLTPRFLEGLGEKEAKPAPPAVRSMKKWVKKVLRRRSIMKDLFAKNNYATDKLRAHSYIPVYEKLFRRRRNKVSNVLEIGIGGGGSLKLWNDYFRNANIYGIDKNYNCRYLDQFSRIHQIMDDAYTQQCVQKHFLSRNIRFDVIIDDGPHSKKSQMMAMQLYFPLLTKDGVIVIEDVQDHLDPGTWVTDIVESLPEAYREYAKVIDLRHLKKSPDDLLIILDKSRIKMAEKEASSTHIG